MKDSKPIVEKSIAEALKSNRHFETFVKAVSQESNPRNISQIKCHTITVGTCWEEFCKEYAIHILNWQVWSLKDCPYLEELKMKRRDVGIDLVAQDQNQNFIAIQCKFRKNFQRLSWRDLSTFDALCMRTGPWFKHVVMTTSTSVTREGCTLSKDVFYGKRHFETLSRHEWLKIAGYGEGNVCGGKSLTNAEDLRQARLKFLENSTKS